MEISFVGTFVDFEIKDYSILYDFNNIGVSVILLEALTQEAATRGVL